MDAFYASAEQLTRPTLRDRPVLVGGLGPRGVVAGASYQARVFGARSAMPMGQARRLCPHATVLPPRFALYQALSEQVMGVLADAAPVVEPVSLDEAFLEPPQLAGAAAAEVERFAAALRADVRSVTGLPASVGAGSGKQLAKIASELAKPDGLRVVDPAAQHDVLAPLPVRMLWGVGPVAEAALLRAGVQTIGELAALDAREARTAAGRHGRHRAAPPGPGRRRPAGRAAGRGQAGERRDHVRRRPHGDERGARRRRPAGRVGAPAAARLGARGPHRHGQGPQRRLHHRHPLGDRHRGQHRSRRAHGHCPAPGPRGRARRRRTAARRVARRAR